MVLAFLFLLWLAVHLPSLLTPRPGHRLLSRLCAVAFFVLSLSLSQFRRSGWFCLLRLSLTVGADGHPDAQAGSLGLSSGTLLPVPPWRPALQYSFPQLHLRVWLAAPLALPHAVDGPPWLLFWVKW